MIKRIKRKKNPRNDRNRLINAIGKDFFSYYDKTWFLYNAVYTNTDGLSNRLCFIKQGYECDDCEEEYPTCECEYCSDCKFNRCLCLLDIVKKSEYSAKEQIRVAKVWWELARLMDEPLQEIYPMVESFKEYSDDKKFIKFLESLTPESSFPEYREIALNLLEAYDDKVDLSKENLSYYDLSGMDLSNMDLVNKNFLKSNLSKTDLSNTDLSDSYLRNANLSYSDLTNANLQRADLRFTNLNGTNLSGVDLYGADLLGADFKNSILTKTTNFKDAYFIDEALNLKIPNPRIT